MEKIEYNWPGMGKLEVNINGNKSASLRFSPELLEGGEKELFDEHEETEQNPPIKPQGDQGIKDTKQCEKNLLNPAKEQKTKDITLFSFSEVSRRCQTYLKEGYFDKTAEEFKNLALILHTEKKYVDELKIVMFLFYTFLNEEGCTDLEAIDMARRAVEKGGIKRAERYWLWNDTIFEECTRQKFISVFDAFFFFEAALTDDDTLDFRFDVDR